ncbi:unnamed protein product [Diamesa serratosioi]
MDAKSKIPVRDLGPLFKHVSNDNHRKGHSRKERRAINTFSATFHGTNVDKDRTRSLERNLRIEKMKDMRNVINIKENQIHDLVDKVTKLYECQSECVAENERLRREKIILAENYNELCGKFDDRQPFVKKGFGKMNNLNESPVKIDNPVQYHEMLNKENVEMKNDLKMLKILVFRLNKHIEYYQDLLRERDLKYESPLKMIEEDGSTTKWSVSSNVLAPLLNSYEERIQEKNDIIGSYEVELNNISGKVKKVLEENEKLHEMYDKLKINSDVWISERDRLNAQCDILKNKATIHCKRADLAKEKLMEILKAYEQKVQSQSLDIERLQEAYNRSKGEISTLKSFQNNPEAVAESIKDCQKLFEDLKVQYEVEKGQILEEKHKLSNELMNKHQSMVELEKEIQDLNGLLEKQKLCNEALNEKNKYLKKNLHHERQSKETLQSEMNEAQEFGKDKFRESWQNMSELHSLIQEKEIIIQNLKFNQAKEVEDLKWKLSQRDQTLKKVLESKITASSTNRIK